MNEVLAKYDLRSKQQYIYRTNAVQEIIGASMIITCVYENFLNGLSDEKQWKISKHYDFVTSPGYAYINHENTPFKPDLAANHGEVVSVGGGNMVILWRNRETALEANRFLCAYLRDRAYSLSAVCGITDYTGDYAADMAALEADFNKAKAVVPPFLPSAILPFTELDRKTALPIVQKKQIHGSIDSQSRESVLKQNMYYSSGASKNGETEFDRMVTGKGTESLLAVIYIDGNNMGARVRAAMQEHSQPIHDYPEAVHRIRSFSNRIQASFVSSPRKAIEEKLTESGETKYRFIVAGGDEMTVVCNARAALKIVQIYFAILSEENRNLKEADRNTACAGICVFHSHYPFSSAYAVAEECCENAKKKNRALGGNCMLLDFQHCFGGAVGTLEDMRRTDDLSLIGRPFSVTGQAPAGVLSLDAFLDCGTRLSILARKHIKDLSSLQVSGRERFDQEIQRLKAQFGLDWRADDAKYLHDIAQFYDIWFAGEVK